tara:strand:+ start:225 stop:416 length:192 start_codon:yes stop_codon:yes gene_type:complete
MNILTKKQYKMRKHKIMTKLENAIIEANNKVIEAKRELTKWQIKHEERVLQKIALETVKGDNE